MNLASGSNPRRPPHPSITLDYPNSYTLAQRLAIATHNNNNNNVDLSTPIATVPPPNNRIPPSPSSSVNATANNLLNLSSPSPAPNLPNYGTHSRSSSQTQTNWSALRHTPGANASHNSTQTSNSTSNNNTGAGGTINPAQFLQGQGQQRQRQGRTDSQGGNNQGDLMDMTMLSSGLTSPTEVHEQMFKAFATDPNIGISNARMNVDSTETSMENSPVSMGEGEGGNSGMKDQRGFANQGWDGQNVGEGQNGHERNGNQGNNGMSLLETFAKSQYPNMGYGASSGAVSGSARFDDDDLLALMSSHNFDANGFVNNGAGTSQQHGAAFFSALQNPPQGHSSEDYRLLEAINQNFGMGGIPSQSNDQPGPPGSSYVHVESAASGLPHLHGQPYANSAPAAYDHPHHSQHHPGQGGLPWGHNAAMGGQSFQPYAPHGGSGPMGQHSMGPGMGYGGMPIHAQFMHRQMTNETPSLIDPSSGSFSSFAEDASIFSSIMGGKWPNTREPPYEHSGMRHGSGTGSGEMGTPATVLSGMSLEGGQSGSTRSPVSVGGEDVIIIAGDDVEMRDGREEMAGIGSKPPQRGRGRTSNKATVDANGRPKAARRTSSVTAAAGGSGTREQAAAQGGVGKAPRAVSKTRPGHRRTGSSATRNAAGALPSAGGAEGGSTLTSNRIDPSNFQHYLLPSLDGNVFRRPSLGRKFSDPATMSADRPTIELPAVHDYISPGRRGSGGRPLLGPNLSKSRRHSMNDADSFSGRPDVKELAPNNDMMATVDEAAIEDGEDDSPTVLSAEDLERARKSRRRLSHNEVERKRRETINEKIQELETLLPPNVVASAIAARDVESIKEEDEDEAVVEAKAEAGKGKKGKSRNRKVIKKSTVPDKLCKGTVLCLTVDLVKQMQEMLNLKSAREQQLMHEIQRLQTQIDPSGQGGNTFSNRTDHFSGMGDMGVEDLRSVNDFDLQGLASHMMEEGGSSTKSRHPDEHHVGNETDEEAQRLLDGEIRY